MTKLIERIVIDGVPLTAADAGLLRGALERELVRLFGETHGWQGAAVHALQAPAVAITTPVRPADLGLAIARSVHACLQRDA